MLRRKPIESRRPMIYHAGMSQPQSFADFWPYYLREHARPRTRALHYLGTTLVVCCGLAGLITGRAILLWSMPIVGYLFAWLGHFLVEHNRPATFRYPLWSLAADWRMWWLWLTRRLAPELDRAGVARR